MSGTGEENVDGNGPNSLTMLIREVAAGRGSEDALYERVESQLRSMARRLTANHDTHKSPRHTELIDDVFVKLIRRENFTWQDRRHFLRTAAVAMRQHVANYYRHQNAVKRGGGKSAVPLSGDFVTDASAGCPSQIVEVSDLCDALVEKNPLAMEALDHWAFGGWTKAEIAEVMDLTLSQVESLINVARALVERAIGESS